MDEYTILNETVHRQRLCSDDASVDTEDEMSFTDTTDTHKLLGSSTKLAPSLGGVSFHRNGKYAKYSLPGKSSVRRSKLLYSPWTVFSITILFFLMVYIPLFTFRESSGMYPIPGWERNTTRDTVYYVLPQLNTAIIDPVQICDNKMLLLIVVCSSSVNFQIRQSIRETWANTTEFNYAFFRKMHANQKQRYLDINYKQWQDYVLAGEPTQTFPKQPTDDNEILVKSLDASEVDFNVKVVFLVGQTSSNETQLRIQNESDTFGDMIQESFVDSYNNLTLKTIMMLKWVNTNCGDKVKFLMKCDDDSFINVPNLLHVLLGGTIPAYNATVHEFDQQTIKTRIGRNRLRLNTNLLVGTMFCNSKPIAETSSKWYTPVYMYSGNTYPNYLSGTAYVMSMDVASKLYNVSLSTPIFHLEDVYLTGICAAAAHIKPINHPLFSYTAFKDACDLRGLINKHQLSAVEMRHAYDYVTDMDANCSLPDRTIHLRKPKTHPQGCS